MTDQNESQGAPKKKNRGAIIVALFSVTGLLFLGAGIINNNNILITVAIINVTIGIMVLILNYIVRVKFSFVIMHKYFTYLLMVGMLKPWVLILIVLIQNKIGTPTAEYMIIYNILILPVISVIGLGNLLYINNKKLYDEKISILLMTLIISTAFAWVASFKLVSLSVGG